MLMVLPFFAMAFLIVDAAWGLFTPLLNALDEGGVVPEPYPYGSRGPVGAHYLAARYGVRWGDLEE